MRAQPITLTFAVAVLAIAITPASASAETATAQKKVSDDKRVCRLLDPPTGSLIKQRVCLTEDQWKKIEKEMAD